MEKFFLFVEMPQALEEGLLSIVVAEYEKLLMENHDFEFWGDAYGMEDVNPLGPMAQVDYTANGRPMGGFPSDLAQYYRLPWMWLKESIHMFGASREALYYYEGKMQEYWFKDQGLR